MVNDQRLLISIPTYNEAENVQPLFDQICGLKLNGDVLFLDDNSPDGTGAIIDRLAAEHANVHAIHRSGKQGIGSAHAACIGWAYQHGYTAVLTMDCDFTHSPGRIPEFLEHAGSYDVVVGSRYLEKGSLRGWNLRRKTLTHLGHFLTRTCLKIPYDATGAFRLYRLDGIPAGVFDLVCSRGYSFFFESLYVLCLNGCTVKEVPLDLPPRTYGHSKMAFRDALYSLTLLLYLCIKTLIDRQSFLYAEPFVPPGNLPVSSAQGEWDIYWHKRDPAGLLFDLIATFYRKFVIKRALNRFVRKHFPPQAHLLHAGCGSGLVDEEISSRVAISALDISVSALSIYKKLNRNAFHLIHGSILSIPAESATYDGVYNLGVMEHFTEDEIRQILAEFHRVLKPGGKILLFWPPAFGLTVWFLAAVHWILHKVGKEHIKLHPDEPTYVRSKKQVRRYFEKTGFELVEFHFGIRDFFTQVVIVGRKRSFAVKGLSFVMETKPTCGDRGAV